MRITRRELLSGLAVVSVRAAVLGTSLAESSTSPLRINPDRLRNSLEDSAFTGVPAAARLPRASAA